MPPWFVIAVVAGFSAVSLAVVGGFFYLARRAGVRRFADFLSEEPTVGLAYFKWLAQYWWLSAFIALAAACAVLFAIVDGDGFGLVFGMLVAVGAAAQASVLRSLHRG